MATKTSIFAAAVSALVASALTAGVATAVLSPSEDTEIVPVAAVTAPSVAGPGVITVPVPVPVPSPVAVEVPGEPAPFVVPACAEDEVIAYDGTCIAVDDSDFRGGYWYPGRTIAPVASDIVDTDRVAYCQGYARGQVALADVVAEGDTGNQDWLPSDEAAEYDRCMTEGV